VSFDNSRITFNPLNDYSGVVMEQGRVQTDADWNELLFEMGRRLQAGALDTMGQAVYPTTTPFAFQIVPSTAAGGSVTIGRGRMYVDGILVENHGQIVNGLLTNGSWDPALAELSGSPQPPLATDANPVPYESQPCIMAAPFPTAPGDYLVYLDVWKQPVTFIEDSNLIDAAIGVDTTGRLKTMWRVSVGAQPLAAGATCQSAAPAWPVSAGQLSNSTVGGAPSGPCCLTTGSGYTGVENQFYRVEIHSPGSASGAGATFKWSRENASVQTTVTAINPGTNSAGGAASVLTVASLGRDQVLGFSAGDWVEIANQTNDDLCQPGTLYKIDSVTVANLTITLTTTTAIALGSNTYTRLIRWDQSGTVYNSANVAYTDLDAVETGPLDQGFYGIPVPTDGTGIILENGVVVTFGLSPSTGSYLPMDFWNFSARTATLELDPLVNAPPRGQHHHYAQLAIATVAGGVVTSAPDCRTPWPPSADGECGCCTTCSVGTGGAYSTIAAALKALPDNGGEICILAGDHYENVVISGKRNIVIRGCKWQTHIFSASLDPNAPPGGTPPAGAGASGMPAVFTIVDCENIELRTFSVTAADGEIAILLDRALPGSQGTPGVAPLNFYGLGNGDTDVIVEDLILAATTLPALVAVGVNELKVQENRIYMKDVACQWAAVYLSGDDMFFERNWVGLGTGASLNTTPPPPPPPPPPGQSELKTPKKTSGKTAQKTAPAATGIVGLLGEVGVSDEKPQAEMTPGGIHIAGPSKNVYIVENEIVGGMGNGVTLGNFIVLDDTGADTWKVTPAMWEPEQQCSSGGTTQVPGSTTTGDGTTSKIGAGGIIKNLYIDRNRIHKTGMAGIGVIGFWNLHATLEIIRIENLSIIGNAIEHTMLRRMVNVHASSSGYAYGAISLADVENLTIRDNTITDFGYTPGADVCGIFVLHGQVVEISRNQIRETRDWQDSSLARMAPAGDTRVGIMLYIVTPPALEGAGWNGALNGLTISKTDFGDDLRFREKPLYEPGLPALRLQENVVRVAFGLALKAYGYGPFSIVGNHFASGGPQGDKSIRPYDLTYSASGYESKGNDDPLLVSIMNLGLAIEDIDQGNGFAAMRDTLESNDGFDTGRNLADASSGAVLFTNNTCQLEALMSGVRGLASVEIVSLDSVLFNSNLLWLDGPPLTARMDAIVMGQTVMACNNRFQECKDNPVVHSAATLGRANITSQNIASYCLKIEGPAIRRVDRPNVILWPRLCEGNRTGEAALLPIKKVDVQNRNAKP